MFQQFKIGRLTDRIVTKLKNTAKLLVNTNTKFRKLTIDLILSISLK